MNELKDLRYEEKTARKFFGKHFGSDFFRVQNVTAFRGEPLSYPACLLMTQNLVLFIPESCCPDQDTIEVGGYFQGDHTIKPPPQELLGFINLIEKPDDRSGEMIPAFPEVDEDGIATKYVDSKILITFRWEDSGADCVYLDSKLLAEIRNIYKKGERRYLMAWHQISDNLIRRFIIMTVDDVPVAMFAPVHKAHIQLELDDFIEKAGHDKANNEAA